MLPEGWRKETFSDGVNLISGQHVEAQLVNSQGQGVPYLTGPADFPNGEIITTRYTQSGNAFCEKDDILITVKGSGTGKVIRSDGYYAISRQLMAVRAKKYDPNFTYFSLCHNIIRYQDAAAGLIPGIGRNDILSTPILLPPLPEQKKIAAILSTWDRAIEGTEKLLSNSQQQKKALMQHLLTGKKRLPGFTGEWRNLKLKTFLQESVIPSPQPDPKKRITVRLNLNGVEKREVRGTESIDATNYFTRKAGQFIYGKQNIHKGAFGIIPKILDGFETSQDIPCFDFLPNVCPAWFFYYFARENIHNTLETKMTGTGSKRLNQKTFFNLTCLAPPLSEQKAIAAVLTTADEEITALESDLLRLRQEKKALMQQLLTGKIRVAV